MTRNVMAECPIEELNPDWIGLRVEVDTLDGSRVGFRLARYEATIRDGEPLWTLFSAEHPWRTELRSGGRVRWCVAPAEVGRPGAYYSAQPMPQAPVTAPAPPVSPPPAQPGPHSWGTGHSTSV